MLTVDFTRFPIQPGDRVLDIGCGEGRHSLAAQRRGALTIALDLAEVPLKGLRGTLAPSSVAVLGDGTRLPLADGSVTHVILSEVLEHVADDGAILDEATRVLAPSGLLVLSVPRWLPERICWLLSDAYHDVDGGHIRIYRRNQLRALLSSSGLVPHDQHHAHALHVPYWWLKCLVGVDRDTTLTRLYHRFLVHEIMRGPWPNAAIARLLDIAAGKSLVIYARKPGGAR